MSSGGYTIKCRGMDLINSSGEERQTSQIENGSGKRQKTEVENGSGKRQDDGIENGSGKRQKTEVENGSDKRQKTEVENGSGKRQKTVVACNTKGYMSSGGYTIKCRGMDSEPNEMQSREGGEERQTSQI